MPLNYLFGGTLLGLIMGAATGTELGLVLGCFAGMIWGAVEQSKALARRS